MIYNFQKLTIEMLLLHFISEETLSDIYCEHCHMKSIFKKSTCIAKV